MKKVLVIYAHPNPQGSKANRKIVEALFSLPNVKLHSLYETYPEFFVDVEKEKDLLLAHDVVVFQHPFYWYSVPPLLKFWMDAVLEYNFAYGPEGKALEGKDFLLSITAGGPHESYSASGYNNFSTDALLAPLEQTARLCKMNWHKPLVLHHSRSITEAALILHAEKVRDAVLGLSMPGDL